MEYLKKIFFYTLITNICEFMNISTYVEVFLEVTLFFCILAIHSKIKRCGQVGPTLCHGLRFDELGCSLQLDELRTYFDGTLQ